MDLALHRYDEEVVRNESIDSKNKSIVAFRCNVDHTVHYSSKINRI